MTTAIKKITKAMIPTNIARTAEARESPRFRSPSTAGLIPIAK
jgi:hypothetical protein